MTSKTFETELNRQLFHLKTLYDVSRELLGLAEIDAILRNFLLMTLGNFGVVEGFVYLHESHAEDSGRLVFAGIQESESAALKRACEKLFARAMDPGGIAFVAPQSHLFFPSYIDCLTLFPVAHGWNGMLGLGKKLVGESFDGEDKDLLETLVNNLIIVLKNARATEALKSAYEEVSSLNRAKDKLLNHLSHELRTPVALLKTAFRLLEKPLSTLPEASWRRSYDRAERSLARLSEIQCSAEDIILKKEYRQHSMVSRLLDQCADVLEAVTMELFEDIDTVEKVRGRIDEIYSTEERRPEAIHLSRFIQAKMDSLQTVFDRRRLNVDFQNQASPVVYLPRDILDMVVSALIKNAVENTPDQGKIAVALCLKNSHAELSVHDYGVGILPEHRDHVFEGFYPTQEVDAYTTKHPFSFNAGGKGADLLRLKIFSERYHFKIDLTTSRCQALEHTGDQCPGAISRCEHCRNPEDCHASGFTTFTVTFPVA